MPITSCWSRAWSCCQTTTFRLARAVVSWRHQCRRPARSSRSRTSRAWRRAHRKPPAGYFHAVVVSSHGEFGDVAYGHQVAAVYADEPVRGPPLLQMGDRHAHQVGIAVCQCTTGRSLPQSYHSAHLPGCHPPHSARCFQRIAAESPSLGSSSPVVAAAQCPVKCRAQARARYGLEQVVASADIERPHRILLVGGHENDGWLRGKRTGPGRWRVRCRSAKASGRPGRQRRTAAPWRLRSASLELRAAWTVETTGIARSR